jgi:hypothetical protein
MGLQRLANGFRGHARLQPIAFLLAHSLQVQQVAGQRAQLAPGRVRRFPGGRLLRPAEIGNQGRIQPVSLVALQLARGIRFDTGRVHHADDMPRVVQKQGHLVAVHSCSFQTRMDPACFALTQPLHPLFEPGERIVITRRLCSLVGPQQDHIQCRFRDVNAQRTLGCAFHLVPTLFTRSGSITYLVHPSSPLHVARGFRYRSISSPDLVPGRSSLHQGSCTFRGASNVSRHLLVSLEYTLLYSLLHHTRGEGAGG